MMRARPLGFARRKQTIQCCFLLMTANSPLSFYFSGEKVVCALLLRTALRTTDGSSIDLRPIAGDELAFHSRRTRLYVKQLFFFRTNSGVISRISCPWNVYAAA